ncbi:MAG: TonB family protein [Dongiaceae bacterium]
MISGIAVSAEGQPGGAAMGIRQETLRWGGGLLFVLLAHAAGAASLLDWSQSAPPIEPPPPAIMIDLGMAQPAPPPPAPQASIEPPRVMPPAPPQPAMLPQPEMPKVEVPKVESEVALAQPKPDKPKVEKKQPRRKPKPAETPPLPSRQAEKIEQQAAASPAEPAEQMQSQERSDSAARKQESAASAAASAQAKLTWETQVAAHLIKFRRSPRMRYRQPMTAYVQVAIDRQGHVLSRQITRSSGDDRLDESAMAMIDRANPLPAPPSDYEDTRLKSINLPVVFTPR